MDRGIEEPSLKRIPSMKFHRSGHFAGPKTLPNSLPTMSNASEKDI